MNKISTDIVNQIKNYNNKKNARAKHMYKVGSQSFPQILGLLSPDSIQEITELPIQNW